MQKATRDLTYNVHSPHNRPQFTVAPGEVFRAETELCTGGWLHEPTDLWTPEKTCALNPTVVVAVEGTKPGDMLAVDILEITPDRVGYTGFINASNPLATLVRPIDWGYNVKTVEIRDGLIHWSDSLRLPVQPMIGTLGTAPAEEVLSNAKAGPHGGNMDVQEVRVGSRVYLPVAVPGALLHIGDVHALQGDGEVNCSGGIECRAEVVLRVEVMPGPTSFECVRIEDEAYLMTVACERSVEESFYLAMDQMLHWIEQRYGTPPQEAFLLMGQVLKARNTQFVNPTRSYICKMPKQYLG